MSTQLTLDMKQGRSERDKGIEQAMSSANAANPGWSERAYKLFVDWLKGWQPGFKFTIEEFRQIARIRGLEDPPSNRAFGGLAVKARVAGLIKSNGTVKVKNPRAHMANANQWQKI